LIPLDAETSMTFFTISAIVTQSPRERVINDDKRLKSKKKVPFGLEILICPKGIPLTTV
jgi:hypothetical protein